jgi:hypothetical protein
VKSYKRNFQYDVMGSVFSCCLEQLEDFVVIPNPKENQKNVEMVKTERYPEDWVAKLKAARRSVLITLENKTSRIFERMESSVRHGLWRQLPPEKINGHSEAMFGNESTGLSGAEGKVLYITTASSNLSESTIVTLLWRNTLFGCNFDYQITTNAIDEKLFVKIIEVKKESAAEVIFQVTDCESESDSTAEISGDTQNVSNADTTEFNKCTSQKSEPSKTKVKKAIKLFQEEGISRSVTAEFRSARERILGDRKEKISRFVSRYEMVSHQIIQYYKNANVMSSFLNSLLGVNKVETIVDLIDPNIVSTCYVCQKPFVKPKEKMNCQLCGQVVHSTDKHCYSMLPFPTKFTEELNTAKMKLDGIAACSFCESYVQDATSAEQWAAVRRHSARNPLIPLQQRIYTTCRMISGQLTLYRAQYTPESENSPLAKEIYSLIDQLEIQLAELKGYMDNFGLIEDDKRTATEKRLQNSLVQAFTQFRTHVLNTLQELKE